VKLFHAPLEFPIPDQIPSADQYSIVSKLRKDSETFSEFISEDQNTVRSLEETFKSLEGLERMAREMAIEASKGRDWDSEMVQEQEREQEKEKEKEVEKKVLDESVMFLTPIRNKKTTRRAPPSGLSKIC
jgi:hypothetical protein